MILHIITCIQMFSFVYLLPKLLNYLVSQSVDFECTWWWLFWVYLMMVIPNLSILSVPDDGYSQSVDFECTWWWLFPICRFWVYLMMVIPNLSILSVPDDGYSQSVDFELPDDGYFECTWWWLFQTFDIYVFNVIFVNMTIVRPRGPLFVVSILYSSYEWDLY